MSEPKPCGLLASDGTFDGYACTLPHGHTGDHEAHAWGPGNAVKTWPQRRDGDFERGCALALEQDDAEAFEAVQRGDAAPEEVEARRKQMRVIR